jgi:hypothetical protein
VGEGAEGGIARVSGRKEGEERENGRRKKGGRKKKL